MKKNGIIKNIRYLDVHPYQVFLIVVIEDIRLFGGLTPNVGRLEVKVYGEWGTVCDDSWELRDAAVVCRVLGFTAARTVRNHAYYGEGSGKIWYGDVECSGSEESLNDCPKSNVGVHNCLHSDDAGVVCTSYYTQSGPNPAGECNVYQNCL